MPFTADSVIQHTQKWLKEIVIKLNFCPFANQPFIQHTIRYHVVARQPLKRLDSVILNECRYLDTHPEVETTLIILPDMLQSFQAFNMYIQSADRLLERKHLIRKYQLAHFHPDYVFAHHPPDDAANYTNRSPYPILHLLRRQSLTRALQKIPHPHQIPDHNIATARQMGVTYFRDFLNSLYNSNHT